MNSALKSIIVGNLKDAIDRSGESQNKYAERLGISPASLSQVLAQSETVSPKMWAGLWEQYGMAKLPTLDTPNFRAIINLAESTRRRKRLTAIAAGTGLGKTTALKHISKEANTFYVLATASMSRRDFIYKVADALEVSGISSNNAITQAIADKLNSLDNALLIIDDLAKLSTTSRLLIQELRDLTEGRCGILLAGTEYLKYIVLQGVSQGWNGYPELNRRIGYWLDLEAPDYNTVKGMAEHVGITDRRAVTYLKSSCTNYGTLNEMLENAVAAMALGHDPNSIEVLSALEVSHG